MKLLKDIVYGVRIADVVGSTNIAIEHVAYDSRKVVACSIFIAIKGTQVDGHEFINSAIKNGAIAIICEDLPARQVEGVTYVMVPNAGHSLGVVAANFYDHPSESLKLIGVTGTNGKTTSVTLLYNLFRMLGYKVGLLSTVVNKIHNTEIEATHTTPNSLELNEMLALMVDKGCTHCFMEVSSHAVDQNRIAGLKFTGAVFTNITRDHLDYHGTFDAYIKAKKNFFDGLSSEAFALTNIDQLHGETMVQDCKAEVRRYAIQDVADYRARIIESQFDGLQLLIDGHDLYTKLIGGFNAYNALVAYSVAMELGEDKLDVLAMLSNLKPPEGRFQYLRSQNGVTAIVDYAHTPDALQNVLNTIKDIRTGNESVITVVGCGGDRDKGKRPQMAKIACKYSDRIIFTSDNPRSENPEKIIDDMMQGVDSVHLKKTISIPNRKEAIKMACSMANQGDILLVAGKGHEKCQEVDGEKLPFDDCEVISEMFNLLGK